MPSELDLFTARERKVETLTLRLTKEQKERLNVMACRGGMSMSLFVLMLIGREHIRVLNEEVFNDSDDGLPF
jgi:predicted DNA-binding protein